MEMRQARRLREAGGGRLEAGDWRREAGGSWGLEAAGADWTRYRAGLVRGRRKNEMRRVWRRRRMGKKM
jgi:hypothetical protein